MVDSGTVEPLGVEPGTRGSASDHRVALITANIPRIRSFEWQTYKYRYFNDESSDEFGRWLVQHDWAGLIQMQGSNEKAEAYQDVVTGAMEKFFPLITVRRKTTDCQWINRRIRVLVKRRKKVYRKEGRSDKWHRLKKLTEEMIFNRRKKYLESQKKGLLVEDAARNFFRNVKAFQSKERPKPFDVRELFPGKSDPEVAEELAEYFNRISHEFSPLEPSEILRTHDISCTMLASKIYESYVLNWLSTEVQCKRNQYGGIKGCSVSHLLVDLWNEIATNLEDARAATMITAIDYAKAFNRLSFQHCMAAFARKGASSQTIALLATFLSNRTLTVRVADAWSAPQPVFDGVPQGSILGVMLFNVFTDDLEDEETKTAALRYSGESSSQSATTKANPGAGVFIPSASPGLIQSPSRRTSSASDTSERPPLPRSPDLSCLLSSSSSSPLSGLDPRAVAFSPSTTSITNLSGSGNSFVQPTPCRPSSTRWRFLSSLSMAVAQIELKKSGWPSLSLWNEGGESYAESAPVIRPDTFLLLGQPMFPGIPASLDPHAVPFVPQGLSSVLDDQPASGSSPASDSGDLGWTAARRVNHLEMRRVAVILEGPF